MVQSALIFFIWPLLEASAEILEKNLLVSWSKGWHQKDISKLTDLYGSSIFWLLATLMPTLLKNGDVIYARPLPKFCSLVIKLCTVFYFVFFFLFAGTYDLLGYGWVPSGGCNDGISQKKSGSKWIWFHFRHVHVHFIQIIY